MSIADVTEPTLWVTDEPSCNLMMREAPPTSAASSDVRVSPLTQLPPTVCVEVCATAADAFTVSLMPRMVVSNVCAEFVTSKYQVDDGDVSVTEHPLEPVVMLREIDDVNTGAPVTPAVIAVMIAASSEEPTPPR